MSSRLQGQNWLSMYLCYEKYGMQQAVKIRLIECKIICVLSLRNC